MKIFFYLIIEYIKLDFLRLYILDWLSMCYFILQMAAARQRIKNWIKYNFIVCTLVFVVLYFSSYLLFLDESLYEIETHNFVFSSLSFQLCAV